MQPRVKLLKRWADEFGNSYPVGTILQVTPAAGSELVRTKVAEKYTGFYPPKEKVKIDLKQLNGK